MSTNAREQRGRELADRLRIVQNADGEWSVPSDSGQGKYAVHADKEQPSCTCKDFGLTGERCKHLYAVWFVIECNASPVVEVLPAPIPAPVPEKTKRKTYSQDWPNYNAAQTNERRHFLALLADLCSTIPEPPSKPGPGRKPIPMADAVFAAIYKVYSMLSARRFSGALEEAHGQGYIGCMPHFNSVLNVFDNPAVSAILTDLVQRAALPLREVETAFAFDSSGFTTSRFTRWYDVKYGVMHKKADWVKVHIGTGVKTNVVTAIEILDKDAADVSQFPALVKATAKGFTIAEASADLAYASTENFQALADCGATGYIPFKKNITGAVGGLFEKAFHFFCLNRDEFMPHYHKRSNVESTFSMVKRKFGDSVRSKTDTAMKNEALAKFVCHNLCCLISAWYELDIEPVFAKMTGCTSIEEPAQILRFPGA